MSFALLIDCGCEWPRGQGHAMTTMGKKLDVVLQREV